MLGAGNIVIDKTDIVFMKSHVCIFSNALSIVLLLMLLCLKVKGLKFNCLSMNLDSSVYLLLTYYSICPLVTLYIVDLLEG